jgi:hypothetical protein
MRRTTAASFVSLAALLFCGAAWAAPVGESQPPDYGTRRRRSPAPDYAAAGALLGAIPVPLMMSIPPWKAYATTTRDDIVGSEVGEAKVREIVIPAAIVSVGAGAGLGFGGWMVGGGYQTGRWPWALTGGLVGGAMGAGVGTGFGLLVHRPWTGRIRNTSGEREWVFGYTLSMITLTTCTGVGATAGILIGGGKVEGKKREDVQLVMALQPDAEGTARLGPTLRGRW